MGLKITMVTLMMVFFVTVHASPFPSWSGLCGYFCTTEFNPVCGKLPNGELKIFPNKCELRRAVCRGLAEHADELDCGIKLEDAVYFADGISVSA